MSALIIAGYASLFGHEDLGGDIVERGAFAESLSRRRSVPMLYQHEAGEPVGRWTRIIEDRRGLWVEGEILALSPRGRTASDLVARGVLDGLSIGFRTRGFTPRRPRGRRLTSIDLWEVSIVTFPMLPQARLQVQPAAQKAA